MKYSRFFLLILVVFLHACAQKHTVYIVRHAEKATEPASDVYLSQAGRNRAHDLKRLLIRSGITKIYSTNYNRTRETAMPVGSELGVPITTYPNNGMLALVRTFPTLRANALIVGHSNTVLTMLDSMKVPHTIKTISETDYDNIFVVMYKNGKVWKFKESTYGKKTD